MKKQNDMLRAIWTIALVLIIPLAAMGCEKEYLKGAEKTAIEVPHEGWEIRFESPPLAKKEESRGDDGYTFRGSSGRFTITFFVRQPQGEGTTNKDSYNFYWPPTSQNTLIVKDSVVTSETPQYFRVQYIMVVEIVGRAYRQLHTHYYFSHGGKWAEVHISVPEDAKEDKEVLEVFDKTFSYGLTSFETAPASSVRSFPVPNHGVLVLAVPPSWMDVVHQPPNDLPPTYLFSPKNGNRFELLMTVFWNMKPGENITDPGRLKEMVTARGQTLLSTAIEKELTVLELRRGETVGYYYVLTDKVYEPGGFPYRAQGAIGMGDLLLSFTLLFKDKDSDELQAPLDMLINAKYKR
jgi:hypothetical protein